MQEFIVKTRILVPEDLPEIGPLLGQLGYPASTEELESRLGNVSGQTLVATSEGRVVGLLTTSIMWVLHRPAPIGRLSALVVSESMRGRGVGKALVRAAEAMLLEQGCAMVEVSSNSRRVQAHAFYEHLGYELTSVRFKIDLPR